MKSAESFGKKISLVDYLVSVLVFPYSAIVLYKSSKAIDAEMKKNKIFVKDLSVVVAVLAFIGLGFVSMTILQTRLNKLARIEK